MRRPLSERRSAATPRALGFSMPGEWTRHAATWIAWPHERSDWPGRFRAIPAVYAEIVRELVRGERVEIVVGSSTTERAVARLLARSGSDLERIGFHRWPTDRSWIRDSGPTFVVRSRRGSPADAVGTVRWRFNAWAKYDNWQRDATIGARIAAVVGGPSWVPALRGRRIVLEGGAIDASGTGLVLATEECLLGTEQARNPGCSRSDIESVLSAYLRADRVLWLPYGIVGDDTHGHVDDVARFVGPSTIVAAVEPDPRDPNHGPLAANRARLRTLVGHGARRPRVLELPMPGPLWFRRQRLPASYANFYIANDSVLVPTFDDPADGHALKVLAPLFPGRRVVGIPSRDLVVGLGTLHCLTQPEFATTARWP